jgi:hypothetical protein
VDVLVSGLCRPEKASLGFGPPLAIAFKPCMRVRVEGTLVLVVGQQGGGKAGIQILRVESFVLVHRKEKKVDSPESVSVWYHSFTDVLHHLRSFPSQPVAEIAGYVIPEFFCERHKYTSWRLEVSVEKIEPIAVERKREIVVQADVAD